MAESIDRAPTEDDFYIGYLPQAPASVARVMRRSVLALLLLAALCAAILALGQRPFDISFFEFGAPRSFVGTVLLEPYPMLRLDRPGQSGGDAETAGEVSASHYLVVAFGKSSARQALTPFDGQRVELQGSLIYRDDQTMLELVDGSLSPLPSAEAAGAIASDLESWGEVTLRGEIVDSKCYLGVMKPGHHKPHRACASLCIRGGMPPLFVPYGDDPANAEAALPAAHLLLVGPQRRALSEEILDWLAEPVELTGRVHRLDDVWMIEADPRSFQRSVK